MIRHRGHHLRHGAHRRLDGQRHQVLDHPTNSSVLTLAIRN
ncbi:hypothetical protein [Massilia phosphatilytica]